MLRRWWKRRQRAIDKQILWPSCKEQAPDLDTARGVMLLHASMDPAWNDLTDDEKVGIISDWR